MLDCVVCCSVLQCVAVCCSCCSVLQCAAECCCVLLCAAEAWGDKMPPPNKVVEATFLHVRLCSVLHCVAVCYNVL